MTMRENDMDTAISDLRAHCNKQIARINQGAGTRTPCFPEINAFLKLCDAVFEARDVLNDAPSTVGD